MGLDFNLKKEVKSKDVLKRRDPVPRYRIENRITKEVVEVEAPFAQTACEKVGWAIGNCYVKLLKEGPFSNIREGPKKVGI